MRTRASTRCARASTTRWVRNVENLILEGSGSFNGTGNALDNMLIGNSGNNLLNGGAGADTMIGGLGNDIYYVDNGGMSWSRTPVRARIRFTPISTTRCRPMSRSSIYTAWRSVARSTRAATAGSTVTRTRTFWTGAAARLACMAVWATTPTYVDDVTDAVVENANEGIDTVRASVSHTLGANVENLILEGSGNLNGAGNALDNTLTGNSGNNVLNGGAGADTMIGGLGNDIYYVDDSDDVVVENANEGIDTVRASISYTLDANVENLILEGSGSLNGTGNALNNTLTGNSGNNVLNGGAGADTMIGGLSNDTYVVDDAADVVVEAAGEGTDTVYAYCDYTMPANVEILNLHGLAIRGAINAGGNGWIYGNANANILDGRGGTALMYGGLGDDTDHVDDATDVVVENANEGMDTVRASISYTLDANIENLILEGSGSLNGTGNALNNTLTGNSGNNVLNGGAGADTMIGGLGNDTYVVDDAADVVVEAGEGTDTVYAYCDYTMPANVEILNLHGLAIRGAINAGGNGWIYGNANANILDGRGGTALMYGGLGDDTYYVDDATDVVVESANEGMDTVRASISYTLDANIENLILEGSGSLNGTGNALNNTLTGNSGNNVLNGGAGADTMIGGLGNDVYYVDDSGDVVVENAVEGIDTVRASITYTLGANVENLILEGSGNLNGTGNALDNMLTGNSGNNLLYGGAGADTMIGGLGDDTYFVENPGDVVIENLNEGVDTVRASISYALGANVEHLILEGAANINGTGNALNNTLTGNSAANILEGKGGVDVLWGYGGADTFVLGPPDATSADRVMDFSRTEGDKLAIRAVDYGLTRGNGLNSDGSLDSRYFQVAEKPTIKHAELFFQPSSSTLYWDADGSGKAHSAVALAIFTIPAGADPSKFLQSADFLVM